MRRWVGDRQHTGGGAPRRSVLRGAAGAAVVGAAYGLGGCGIFDREPDPEPNRDPLHPLLTGALELATRHEAAMAAHQQLTARLGPIRDAHLAHAAELARVIGAPAPRTPNGSGGATTGSPTPGSPAASADPNDTLAKLRSAEEDARVSAAQACLAAPARRAGLVGSIAAARATHAEVLR